MRRFEELSDHLDLHKLQTVIRKDKLFWSYTILVAYIPQSGWDNPLKSAARWL